MAKSDDERRQRVLAAETAARSDVVALVEPIGTEGQPAADFREIWHFRVTDVLTGVAGGEIELSVLSRVTVSCAGHDEAFFDNGVQPGHSHILYLKDGNVLRLASSDRPINDGWMPMWREIRIVRKVVEASR